jgi:hypothetical protein
MVPALAALLALVPQKSPDRALEGAAARCGTEIPWTTSLEDARRLARESGKPIAWWVTTLDGSPMDRKLVVEKYMLAGPFMMPAVIEHLSTRFVPLRMAGRRAHRASFGVAPLDFIEPGFVFLDADLKVVHKVDRISTFSDEWFDRLLRGVLRKAGCPAPAPPPAPAHPRQALAGANPDPALFEKLEGDEARWLHGVALHLAGRDEEGRAEWRKTKEGRWAAKAAAELARDGPFVRGFEILEALPEDALADLPASTTLPRAKADVPRAVRFLLQNQRADGRWDDSHYNFGGDDSLPNVYMAVTAIAAMALRAWGGEGAKAAVERAERYMKDESRIAADDSDEIAWAHAYRLLYFAGTGDRETAARLVGKLRDLQRPSGTWYHEYENPFVTATALHALDEAAKAGSDDAKALISKGLPALRSCRDEKGIFSYGFPDRGGDVRGAAGRMPFCEFALFLAGDSTKDRLAASVEESFKHHALLERVRKYDDHADRFHNGGFFFWYDQYGRALAAKAAGAQAALARQKEVVLSVQEIDGCWVDSHELGRVYGTAMALLTLKLCE